MNIHKMVSKVLNQVNPIHKAIWHRYVGQEHNRGKPVPKYEDIAVQVTMQLASPTQLKHYEGLDYTLPYWNIWIDKNVDTQNIAANKGGDLITINQIDYKIVALAEDFNTGWVKVIGTPQ